MDMIEWRKEWETGHPLIDFDHRGMVDLANALRRLVHAADVNLPSIDRLMIQLGELMHKHFRREEDLLRQGEFPDLDAHCAYHRTFEACFGEFFTTWERAPDRLDLKAFSEFFDTWVVQHTLQEASELARHLPAWQRVATVTGTCVPSNG